MARGLPAKGVGTVNRVVQEVFIAEDRERELKKIQKARAAEAKKKTVRVVLDNRTVVYCSPDKVEEVKEMFVGCVYGTGKGIPIRAKSKQFRKY